MTAIAVKPTYFNPNPEHNATPTYVIKNYHGTSSFGDTPSTLYEAQKKREYLKIAKGLRKEKQTFAKLRKQRK